jgi:probable HAF family extracellular repeat protein
MNSVIRYGIALLLLCLMGFAAEAGLQYKFAEAGNFPGAYYSVPLGVTLGHIVGYYVSSSANAAYVQTGTTFIKAAPAGSFTSYLSGVNKYGVAVGGYCSVGGGCNPEVGERGYWYDLATGKITTIHFPMKGAATTAYGINDKGSIVGGYCPNAVVCPQGAFSPALDGFIETNGVFTTLNYPGAQATTAAAINNAGAVVGFYDINNTGPHAFLYQNGTFTNIDYPGSNYTAATAINNGGVVAGYFSSTTTGLHGFTYQNGKFTQIDKPKATGTAVTGINDRNDLVGVWYPTRGEENFKAVPLGSPEEP